MSISIQIVLTSVRGKTTKNPVTWTLMNDRNQFHELPHNWYIVHVIKLGFQTF